jgi:DNA gyrase subunit B
VYVAQPPLYRVRRKGREHYVQSDREMKMTLLKLGVEGATLRFNPEPGSRKKTADEIAGAKLEELSLILTDAEELVRSVERRGVPWETFLAARNKAGEFPSWAVRLDGAMRLFHTEAEARKAVAAAFPRPKKEANKEEAGKEELPEEELPEPEELFGAKELNKIARKLETRGLELDDWHLEARQGVGDEKAWTKFTVATEDEAVDVAGVAQILSIVRRLGQKGMDIQRFKGLGEMNAEQLWETTMDPARRVLKKVLIEDAAEAEHIFSVLMGPAVEPRREFIERHALEVRNLDV